MQTSTEAFKKNKAPHRPALILFSMWADLLYRSMEGRKGSLDLPVTGNSCSLPPLSGALSRPPKRLGLRLPTMLEN